MSTQSLDYDIYDYGFILNSTALHEAAMSVLVTTIYGRWRTITIFTGELPSKIFLKKKRRLLTLLFFRHSISIRSMPLWVLDGIVFVSMEENKQKIKKDILCQKC